MKKGSFFASPYFSFSVIPRLIQNRFRNLTHQIRFQSLIHQNRFQNHFQSRIRYLNLNRWLSRYLM